MIKIKIIEIDKKKCNGLLGFAKKTVDISKRKIPTIKSIVVGIKGDILKEEII